MVAFYTRAIVLKEYLNMTKWISFECHGIHYHLSHLQPKAVIFLQPADKGKPERKFKVVVSYSHHCFSRHIEDEEQIDRDMIMDNPKKTDPRIFDQKRYELSQKLPGIIEDLGNRICFHTDHSNFFTIEILDDKLEKIEYEVYFKVFRSETDGLVNLIVQSAYTRDAKNKENRPKKKKINFFTILFNTQHKKRIRRPE